MFWSFFFKYILFTNVWQVYAKKRQDKKKKYVYKCCYFNTWTQLGMPESVGITYSFLLYCIVHQSMHIPWCPCAIRQRAKYKNKTKKKNWSKKLDRIPHWVEENVCVFFIYKIELKNGTWAIIFRSVHSQTSDHHHCNAIVIAVDQAVTVFPLHAMLLLRLLFFLSFPSRPKERNSPNTFQVLFIVKAMFVSKW